MKGSRGGKGEGGGCAEDRVIDLQTKKESERMDRQRGRESAHRRR